MHEGARFAGGELCRWLRRLSAIGGAPFDADNFDTKSAQLLFRHVGSAQPNSVTHQTPPPLPQQKQLVYTIFWTSWGGRGGLIKIHATSTKFTVYISVPSFVSGCSKVWQYGKGWDKFGYIISFKLCFTSFSFLSEKNENFLWVGYKNDHHCN